MSTAPSPSPGMGGSAGSCGTPPPSGWGCRLPTLGLKPARMHRHRHTHTDKALSSDALPHTPCLANAGRYKQSTQGTPLSHLALVAKAAGIPELHRNANRQFLAGHAIRALHRQQTGTQPQSSGRKACVLRVELQCEGQASGFPCVYRLRRCSQRT